MSGGGSNPVGITTGAGYVDNIACPILGSAYAEQILEGAHPERVVTQAVKRMLPGNRLSRVQMSNLRVYAGAEHPHEAQQPEVLDVAALNPKNKKVA